MKRILIIFILICISTLSAGIAALHSGFAPVGVLDLSAEGPLDFKMEQFHDRAAQEIASPGADSIYYFTAEYYKNELMFEECHFYCIEEDGDELLFDYDRDGDPFWINEFVATEGHLFWVCKYSGKQYLEGYDLESAKIFTVCEYPGSTGDIITYSNGRYLSWFDGLRPRSLYCLDTYTMKPALIIADIKNSSFYTKPFISADNELIYRKIDPADPENAILYVSDINGNIKYKMGVPADYPILGLNVGKNWIMYYNNSSVGAIAHKEIHCISRRTGTHKVFDTEDLSIDMFSASSSGDHVFINDNSSQIIYVLSIPDERLYRYDVDGRLYMARV